MNFYPLKAALCVLVKAPSHRMTARTATLQACFNAGVLVLEVRVMASVLGGAFGGCTTLQAICTRVLSMSDGQLMSAAFASMFLVVTLITVRDRMMANRKAAAKSGRRRVHLAHG